MNSKSHENERRREAGWVHLNPEELNRVESQQINGIEITLGMSPYDLPEGVRGFYSKSKDKFVIQFKYLGGKGSEGLVRHPSKDARISMLLGEHSGRLRQIQIDVDSTDINQIQLRMICPKVEDAITELTTAKPARRANYEVARDIIAQNKNRLLAGVAD